MVNVFDTFKNFVGIKRSDAISTPVQRKDSLPISYEKGANRSTVRWGTGYLVNDLRNVYSGQGLPFKILNKYTNDTFNYWFEVHSDNPQLIEAIEKINSPPPKWATDEEKKSMLDFKRKIREAGLLTYKYGYCPLMILFNAVDSDLKNPIELTNAKVEGFFPIPRPKVANIVLQADQSKENYGWIDYYQLSGTGKYLQVHYSRAFHLCVFKDDMNVEGIPLLGPAKNYIDQWEDFIWSVGKGFFRHGMGFAHKTIKADEWNMMTDEQRNNENSMMKNINTYTGFVGPDTETLSFIGAGGTALNPEQYADVILDAIGMSINMPRTVLRGLLTGAVTGSEVDEREWANTVRGIQDLFWTPVIEESYRLLQKTKQIPQGDFWIEWNSIMHVDDQTKATIEKIEAETRFIELKSGLISSNTNEMIQNEELIQVDPLQTNSPIGISDIQDKSTTIQSLIFSKKEFPTSQSVREWINKHKEFHA